MFVLLRSRQLTHNVAPFRVLVVSQRDWGEVNDQRNQDELHGKRIFVPLCPKGIETK